MMKANELRFTADEFYKYMSAFEKKISNATTDADVKLVRESLRRSAKAAAEGYKQRRLPRQEEEYQKGKLQVPEQAELSLLAQLAAAVCSGRTLLDASGSTDGASEGVL